MTLTGRSTSPTLVEVLRGPGEELEGNLFVGLLSLEERGDPRKSGPTGGGTKTTGRGFLFHT